MTRRLPLGANLWRLVGRRFLPFADVATADLPLGRLLRLSLFQVTVGMATALVVGTLNRVMIVELAVPATIVAVMVSLPLVFAPFRAFIGFKSDNHRSALGWRRVPYIWFGTLAQFGGLSIMPFALMVLSGDDGAPVWLGQVAAALAFLLVGAGMQTTQTAGLALATDLAPESARPRVVALMYVMLLVGMVASGIGFAFILADFTPLRLIQVVQGAAVVTVVLNVVALWKQEARDPSRSAAPDVAPDFKASWRAFVALPGAKRFLVAVALGTAAFGMQDIVLEPYGGEVLGLGVGATTMLTALLALGSLAAFAVAARVLARGFDAYRLAAYGAVVGLPAFAAVILAAPFGSPLLFRVGVVMIGFAAGLFSVATLIAAMGIDEERRTGLALGAWGAVQVTAAGLGMAVGGGVRDLVASVGATGALGRVMADPAAAYSVVYHFEILLLFATLAAIGPLASHARRTSARRTKLGFAELPG